MYNPCNSVRVQFHTFAFVEENKAPVTRLSVDQFGATSITVSWKVSSYIIYPTSVLYSCLGDAHGLINSLVIGEYRSLMFPQTCRSCR